MFLSKSNCKVHRVEPLKETEKLRMGCAATKSSLASGLNTGSGANNDNMDSTMTVAPNASMDSAPYPPPEAFEIPLTDDVERDPDESLIKKHPPKRLQRLTEASVVATTIEDLEDKLAKAEIRRQKYLQERVVRIESGGTNGWRSKDDEDEAKPSYGGNEEQSNDLSNENNENTSHNVEK